MAKYYVEVNGNGTFWHKDEQMKILHRLDGPAIEFADGDKFWYKDGLRHREDGPAREYASGDKFWFIDDVRHRENGPAIEQANGTKTWYKNGKLHREDGPAKEWTNGDVEYWLKGRRLTKEQWEQALRPVEEMTIGDIEKILGKKIKIVK